MNYGIDIELLLSGPPGPAGASGLKGERGESGLQVN